MKLYRKDPQDPNFQCEAWLECLRDCFYEGAGGLPVDRQQADAADACIAEIGRHRRQVNGAAEKSQRELLDWSEKWDALEEEREALEEERGKLGVVDGNPERSELGMSEAIDRFVWGLRSGRLCAFVALGVGPSGSIEVISSMGNDKEQTAQNVIKIVGFMDIVKTRLGNHVVISPADNPGLQLVKEEKE